MPNPTHNDLCAAIMAIGAEDCCPPDFEPEVFHRLAALRLAQWSDGEWHLTANGAKVLPILMDGNDIPSLA